MMRSILHFVFLCLFCCALYAENTVIHSKPLEIEFTGASAANKLVFVQFPPNQTTGIDVYRTNPKKLDAYVDTLVTGITEVTDAGWISRGIVWDGYIELAIRIEDSDIVSDSLTITALGLDYYGNILDNNSCYLNFGTPPVVYMTEDDGEIIFPAHYLDWDSDTWYRARLTGVFGYGVFGVLFTINFNDETSGHTGTVKIRVYLR